MFVLKLTLDIIDRFSYSLPKQTRMKLETRETLSKKEVLAIEKEAMSKKWTKEMLWEIGAKNYLEITLYEYLAWDGGTIYKVCHNHIIVHTTDDKYTFIYKNSLVKRFGKGANGNS